MAAKPAASLALHAVVFPSLDAVEASDPSALASLHAIRTALEKAEAANPGLTHELVDAILESEQSKGGEDSTERLLRVAARDIPDYQFEERTAELKVLADKSKRLKATLSSIPELIADRSKFLTLIRTIAATIKDLLEAVTLVFSSNADILGSNLPELEQQKKVFVRVSKSFSETLKRYFKDGRKDAVLRSAHRLINQTNLLLRTIKIATDSQ